MVGRSFELQLYFYIYFWTNALEKDMNPLSHQLFFFKDGFDIK